MKTISEIQQMVRDLRDSDHHLCPADKGHVSQHYCSCEEYDKVIEELQKYNDLGPEDINGKDPDYESPK